MAKKTTRKPNLPQETLERARRELAQDGEIPVEVAAPVVPAKPQNAPRAVNLSIEYAYVLADLQQMALLAGAILITLVGLSFFI